MRSERDAVVVGGGFFGCMTALQLRRRYRQVVLLERDDDLMRRASYHNQARVHGGYHYPRSLRTALRSRINFPRFVEQFAFCIERGFDKYYAIARQFSKVTARQFRNFFEHIQAPIEPAPASVRRLFNSDLIEDVFRVTEYAFDADRLREGLRQRLLDADIHIRLRTQASRVRSYAGDRLLLTAETPEGQIELVAREVFNCTYADLNNLLAASDLPLIPLQQEWTEMALVRVPEPFAHVGITVMCGPFFSVMPFPPRGLHSLSHVRYTPHAAWRTGLRQRPAEPLGALTQPRSPRCSHFPWMVRDAARFVPILNDCRYVDSLWEIKSVLPHSERDDSRPILFQRHHGLANLHCVLGAKIDNIFDLLEEMDGSPRQEKALGMMNPDAIVSVVGYLCNDADLLRDFVDRTTTVLEAGCGHFELILLDDHSTDRTPSGVESLLAEYPGLRYIRLARRCGEEIAAAAGLDAAIGDYVVFLRGRFDPPEAISDMLHLAVREGGTVLGVTSGTGVPPVGGWLFRTCRRLFYRLVALLLRVRIPSDSTGFCVLSRAVVNTIARTRSKSRHLRLLACTVGYPVSLHRYEPRAHGGTGVSPVLLRQRSLGDAFQDAMRILVSGSQTPLRLVSTLGIVASSLNLCYVLYVLAIYFFKKEVAPGWVTLSLQSSAMFFFVFLILVSLSEYVVQILAESQDNPLYHVESDRTSAVTAGGGRRNVVMDPLPPEVKPRRSDEAA